MALPDSPSLSMLAGGFALWASVSEGRASRWESSRDLLLLAAAAGLGAASFVLLAPAFNQFGGAGPELILVTGAFSAGYLRRFGITGTGIKDMRVLAGLGERNALIPAEFGPDMVLMGSLRFLAAEGTHRSI